MYEVYLYIYISFYIYIYIYICRVYIGFRVFRL